MAAGAYDTTVAMLEERINDLRVYVKDKTDAGAVPAGPVAFTVRNGTHPDGTCLWAIQADFNLKFPQRNDQDQTTSATPEQS